MSGFRRACAFLCLSLLVACGGNQQSVLDPAGPQADKIAGLWWFFFCLSIAIFGLVMALMLWTLTRSHREKEAASTLGKDRLPAEKTESRLKLVVTGGSIATVLILFMLLIASISTGKATADLGKNKNLLTIEVTGNQWWWQFRYLNDDPSQTLTTANEIHIPVGRTVLIRGMSNDVIHSFWVPNLHGKRDLIPSHVTTEYIQADKAGVYRGQCAEFCGLQHAHMSFYVIAESEQNFNAWMQVQLQPTITPVDPILLHGQQSFLAYECIYCHQIRGTAAAGTVGPDLTHFGSRRSLAAGTLPNNLGNLGGWILNPQNIKPGNHMATIAVRPDDLQPLIQYLESLK